MVASLQQSKLQANLKFYRNSYVSLNDKATLLEPPSPNCAQERSYIAKGDTSHDAATYVAKFRASTPRCQEKLYFMARIKVMPRKMVVRN